MTSGSPAPQPRPTQGTDEWRTISDELLQGLVHALNNRVAALSAFVELAKLGDDEGDPLTALPEEIAQLHRVNALFGLLPERKSEAEALELRDVLRDAIHLHEHHPRLRSQQVEVKLEGAPAAVRAPRWALVRALVMLVHAGKRAAEQTGGGGRFVVRVLADDDEVSVRVGTDAVPSADLVALAERCDGSVTTTRDELTLRLPSLRELRRRELVAREGPPT